MKSTLDKRYCLLPAFILLPFCFLLTTCSSQQKGIVPPPPAKNLILISIDTLRADHLGMYGYGRPTSPNLDDLAKESVVYSRAYSSSNWTLPGHAGLLTGLMSSAHRGIQSRDAISREVGLVQESLRKSGRKTAAFTSHIFVSDKYGFDRGFDHFDYEEMASAAAITDKAIRWIEGLPSEDHFFVFLHYFDAHLPYGRDEEFVRKFATGDCRAPVSWLDTVQAAVAEDWEKFDCFQELYDADIAYLDAHIGRFIRFLRSRKLLDESLVVVTSDHGELFGEHGGAGHGLTLFEEEIHVPLIVRYPKAAGKGTKVDQPVSTLQVAPTLLEAARVPSLPTDLPGLAKPLFGEGFYPEWVASETRKTGPDQIAIVRRWEKVFLPPPYKIQGVLLSPRYVDLKKGEDENLWGKRHEEAMELYELAVESGWFGLGTCYELTLMPDAGVGALRLRIEIANWVKPVSLSGIHKFFVSAGKKFKVRDLPLVKDGDSFIATFSSDKTAVGMTLVLDPPDTPVTFSVMGLAPDSEFPILVGDAENKSTEKVVRLAGPTGPYTMVSKKKMPKSYLLIRSYNVLHLNRPNSMAPSPAKPLTPEQKERLRSLGYFGA